MFSIAVSLKLKVKKIKGLDASYITAYMTCYQQLSAISVVAADRLELMVLQYTVSISLLLPSAARQALTFTFTFGLEQLLVIQRWGGIYTVGHKKKPTCFCL